MLSLLKMLFDLFWMIFKYPLYVIIGLYLSLIFLEGCHYLYFRFVKKMKPIKGQHNKVKKKGILRRLLWDLPKQMAKDKLRFNPETFRYQGILIFEGRQGQGKTISMIEQCLRYQEEYPLSFCLSNLDYVHQDGHLTSWDDLIDFQNPNGSHCGVIVCNDELQNSFNSKQSKDFPMEYVGLVTQNRKNRRVLLGTAQNFYMLSKDIRTQCTELRKCNTFFGCLTFVRRYEPLCESSGEVKELKFRGMYFYVQSDDLRSCYDTYEVIKGMRRSGFKPRSEQITAFSQPHTEVPATA